MPVYFATENEKTAELLEALAGSEEAAGKGTATQGKKMARCAVGGLTLHSWQK